MRVALRTWDGADAAGLAEPLRSRTRAGSAGIGEAVAATLAEVASGGDAAAIELGERFDGVRVEELRVPDEVLDRALDSLDPDLRDALEEAAANITTVASAQVNDEPSSVELPQGHRVEVAEVPVGAAAIYAPGGRAPYPSTVLMGAIPARVAGVERVVVASPPGASGLPHGAVLAAARIAGVHEVFAIGGAQAVAALAYGTESIAAVDVIAGPGSPYVQEAKVQLASVVGIDGYAGPSELAVISDSSGATAETVALDLAAQAEHGDDGLLVAICEQEEWAGALHGELERVGAGRESVTEAFVDVILSPSREASVALVEALAPEHLELSCGDAEGLAAEITTAGCVFIGSAAATAFGDYAAGSNHILPTGGAGRFTGPVGPGTFRRRISRVRVGGDAAASLARVTDRIARAEGFPVHGESALARAATGFGRAASTGSRGDDGGEGISTKGGKE